MKPLTHWAIHHQHKIRIGGRSTAEVWGQLVSPDGQTASFRFDLQARRLAIGEGDEQHVIQLDEYGYEVDSNR